MKRNYLFILTTLIILLLISAGVLLAQDSDGDDSEIPEATPEVITCEDDSELIDRQTELSALLIDFDTLVEADRDSALAELYNVGVAYQELAFACGYIPPDAGGLVINTDDMERIMSVLETLHGDPLEGQLLYNGIEPSADNSILGCAGCHETGAVAPTTSGTWTRWDEEHRLEDQFADYTFEQYIAESIIHPNDYLAGGFPGGLMPPIYTEQLGFQDLADIIAYLESQDQLP